MSTPMLDDVLRICSPELRDEILSLRTRLADATQRAERADNALRAAGDVFNERYAQHEAERDAARARIAELTNLLRSAPKPWQGPPYHTWRGEYVTWLVCVDAALASPGAKGDAPKTTHYDWCVRWQYDDPDKCNCDAIQPFTDTQPDAEQPSDADVNGAIGFLSSPTSERHADVVRRLLAHTKRLEAKQDIAATWVKERTHAYERIAQLEAQLSETQRAYDMFRRQAGEERDQALKCLAEAPRPLTWKEYPADISHFEGHEAQLDNYSRWYTSDLRRNLLKGVK